MKLLLTCEHAGNEIPLAYADAFKGKDKLLYSHRGYDIGAYEVFQQLVAAFNSESHYMPMSRLVIEMNRSLEHKELFSNISQKFDEQTKQSLIYDYYLPYRKKVEFAVFMGLQRGYVLHISVHSFTPRLNNETRPNDIGLLYDPKCKHEKELADLWKKSIKKHDSKIKVRFNYPYKGSDDGLTSYLREMFVSEKYYAIELEINQKHLKTPESIDKTAQLLIKSLADVLVV